VASGAASVASGAGTTSSTLATVASSPAAQVATAAAAPVAAAASSPQGQEVIREGAELLESAAPALESALPSLENAAPALENEAQVASQAVGSASSQVQAIASQATNVSGAPSEALTEETVSVYHASVNNAPTILQKGLDPTKVPTFVSRDIAAAQDALDKHLDVVEELSGIIESRIPVSQFQSVLAPLERPYSGFYPYELQSTEITLRTAEHVELFNQYICR
jgi:hypothetical protein